MLFFNEEVILFYLQPLTVGNTQLLKLSTQTIWIMTKASQALKLQDVLSYKEKWFLQSTILSTVLQILLSGPLIDTKCTHLCRHTGDSLVFPKKRRSDHRFYLICLMFSSPGSPLLPYPVQLNTEPWLRWSLCLGRADIFWKTSACRSTLRIGLWDFLCCCSYSKFHLNFGYTSLSAVVMNSLNKNQGYQGFHLLLIPVSDTLEGT